MSLKTSKTILKVFGIFAIICGILVLALAVIGFVGLNQTSAEELASDPSLSSGAAGMAILLAIGVLGLLEGIFAIRGAKDSSKIMPAWLLAIIGVVAAAIGLFTGGSLGSAISNLIINTIIFIAANNIKKSNTSEQ